MTEITLEDKANVFAAKLVELTIKEAITWSNVDLDFACMMGSSARMYTFLPTAGFTVAVISRIGLFPFWNRYTLELKGRPVARVSRRVVRLLCREAENQIARRIEREALETLDTAYKALNDEQ